MPCGGCGKKKRGGTLSRTEQAASIQFIIDKGKKEKKDDKSKDR